MEIQEVSRVARLIYSYLQGSITDGDRLSLDAWRQASPYNERLFGEFCSHAFMERKQIEECLCDDFGAYQKVIRRKEMFFRRRRYRRVAIGISVAAIVTGVLVTALFPFARVDEADREGYGQAIVAGSSKATLVLADGSRVMLTDVAQRDSLLVEGGSRIVKQGGSLDYRGAERIDKLKYNTLQVPRGGNFVVTLDDGTVVYLNAVSELRYPIQFTGKERRVRLTGEAYFEVVEDMTKPFYVEVDGMEIRVYGTVFNVNTHFRGRIETVLVEGRVGIRVNDGTEYVLQPSQLAVYDMAEGNVEVQQVNTRRYTAWQEGWFLFEDERLEEVLDRLSMWYDVDIYYANPEAKELRIYGSMRRYDSIEVILRAIEVNVGVRFSIEGKTVVVAE